jgi:hypothetical protein
MKMAGGFASAFPASAKRTDTTTIDVHTAAANIKQTLGAESIVVLDGVSSAISIQVM